MLILEYNSHFGPELEVTIPADVSLDESAPDGYHGASLAALAKLADRKGYRLLACDMAGINAFFARNDLRQDIPGVSPSRAFRKQRNRLGARSLRAHPPERVFTSASAFSACFVATPYRDR
jgi:hypothetical protein